MNKNRYTVMLCGDDATKLYIDARYKSFLCNNMCYYTYSDDLRGEVYICCIEKEDLRLVFDKLAERGVKCVNVRMNGMSVYNEAINLKEA